MAVYYRKAQPKDAALLATTRQKAWNATYRGIYPDEMIDNFDFPWHIAREEKNLQDTNIHTYLVMDGEECCGYFTYIIRDLPIWCDYHVRLFSLYLLPPLQGMGLGRKIFEHIKNACKNAGFDRFYLSCSPQNKAALGFYIHLGGSVVAEDIGNIHPEEDTIELEFIC